MFVFVFGLCHDHFLQRFWHFEIDFQLFRNGSMNVDVIVSYIVYCQQLSCVNNQHASIC